MFKNTNATLTKLRNVQAKIKKCKDAMEKYNCPKTNWHTVNKFAAHLQDVMNGSMSVDYLVQYAGIELAYLEEFGTYLVNFAKYKKDTQKYQEELNELKKQERELKNALGIE